MAEFRLRKVWPEYRGRVRIVNRALALELKNHRPTPKRVVDIEVVLMARQEPDLPIWPWKAPDFEFVPTLLPAFEAEKAAALQGDEAVWEYSWRLRHAFFAESRTICMRHVFIDIAEDAGLDVERFAGDWDSGLMRELVLAESHYGWEVLQVPGSPTFVLPNGKQIANPGAIKVQWGPNHEPESITAADCPRGDCLQVFRDMLDEAISSAP